MNREIKFRAWDGKEMVEPFVLGSLNAGDWFDSDWNLMQFTGRQDRNGVDIYEGDIVRFSAHYFGDSYIKESVEVIKWNVCQWNDNLWVGYADRPDWCEVIGNIHENSDS